MKQAGHGLEVFASLPATCQSVQPCIQASGLEMSADSEVRKTLPADPISAPCYVGDVEQLFEVLWSIVGSNFENGLFRDCFQA